LPRRSLGEGGSPKASRWPPGFLGRYSVAAAHPCGQAAGCSHPIRRSPYTFIKNARQNLFGIRIVSVATSRESGRQPRRRAGGGEALVADDVTGEAHQDRCEGSDACPVRHLPDGGGRRAQAAVRGDFGADSTASNARDGAGTMARNDETAGGGGGDGAGLPGSTMDARMQDTLGGIMARQRPDAASTEPEECLSIPRIVIESS